MSSRLISPQEVIQARTGIDWSAISDTSGATAALETIEQTNVIDRASAWVARTCRQRLDATTDTETAQLGGTSTQTWVDRYGVLHFKTNYFPIISLTTLRWAVLALNSGALTWNTITASGVQILGDYPRVHRLEDFSQDWTWLAADGAMIQATYVNGWANAFFTSSIAAGSNVAITGLDTTVGFSVGDTPTIYDGSKTEVVTIKSIDSATQLTVTTLANAHDGTTAAIRISEVPMDVNEAVLLACMHFAKEGGTDSWVLGGGRGGTVTKTGKAAAQDPLATAREILKPYTRNR